VASPDTDSPSIFLLRSETFPACRYSLKQVEPPSIPAWGPIPIVQNGLHLEIRLGEQISEGRTALTYSADVVAVNQDTCRDPMSFDIPKTLCAKIAKEKHCRTLAREAWFYEQLARVDHCLGYVAPRCFGFFTARVNDCANATRKSLTRIGPWEKARKTLSDVRYDYGPKEGAEDKVPSDISLNDDLFGSPSIYPNRILGKRYRDVDGLRDNSLWNRWRPSPSDPTIGILLLEKLGDHISRENSEEDLA
jgi:hypothetical protein